MPELPEVETIARQLRSRVLGSHITAITASWPRSLIGDADAFEALRGTFITGIRRRGKLLIIDTDTEVSLLIHLRMTGQLLLEHDAPSSKYERAHIDLEDGWSLHFNDQRKFGRIEAIATQLVPTQAFVASLGPEATDGQAVLRALRFAAPRRSTPIKALLLDQHVVAGIGNIYADEILFCARISPATAASALSLGALRRVSAACPQVLNEAIERRGSTLRDYRDAQGDSGTYLSVARVHGRKGQPCRICNEPIRYGSVAGRGTYWCPRCQRRGARASGN